MSVKYREHQAYAINEWLPAHNRGCLFWEMGTGKTIPMLVHIDNLIALGEVKNALWVGPVTAYAVVEKNIAILPESRQKRLKEHLTVINYDKLSRKGSKWRDEIGFTDWDLICLDEIHKIARPSSNRTQYFIGKGNTLGLVNGVKYRYGLTGTPVNQSRYEDLWAYMRFMFSDDYMPYRDFRSRYLKTFTYPPGSYNQIVSGYTSHLDELKEDVADHVQYKRTSECLDLPECQPDEIIYVPWKAGKNDTGATTKTMYTEAMESYVDCLDMVMDNPLARMGKLRQLASGHIKDENGVTHRLNNHKIPYMVDIVENHGSKVVVFFDFRATREMLVDALDKKGISYYVLDGETKDKSVWKKFQDPEDDTQVFIVHYASGSESIDLWRSHVTIFAEPCLSYTIMAQARARTNRNGQTVSCSFYFMCTEDTIDIDIYNRLCDHEDFSEKFYRDVVRKRLERGSDV